MLMTQQQLNHIRQPTNPAAGGPNAQEEFDEPTNLEDHTSVNGRLAGRLAGWGRRAGLSPTCTLAAARNAMRKRRPPLKARPKKTNPSHRRSASTATPLLSTRCALHPLRNTHNSARRRRQTNPPAPKRSDHPYQKLMTGARRSNLCFTNAYTCAGAPPFQGGGRTLHE